jgi:hypothetical protein
MKTSGGSLVKLREKMWEELPQDAVGNCPSLPGSTSMKALDRSMKQT